MANFTRLEAPKTRVERSFPRVTLQDALRVPTAIKEKNGGNPWLPQEIAKAVNVGAKTGKFYYLTAGSRDYGLTEGTRDSKRIALTALGRAVVYPPSAQAQMQAKRKAFLSVETFRKVLEHYQGNNLPEREYLSNTLLNEFSIPIEVHDEFVDLFQKNCRYLGIGSTLSTDLLENGAVARNGSGVQQKEGSTVTLATPTQGGDKLCFVVMPFEERDDRHAPGFFSEVIVSLITPAAQAAGFIVRTANRQGSDVIQSTIVNDLLRADLVVADLTEHNPNVLFELGMRMAIDKPVALIRAKGTGRIFDVDNMLRVFDYDPCVWPSTVAADLPKLEEHIRAAWDNKERDLSYMKLLNRQPSESVANS
jgi:nucleoside 2-deoxyribosyltransferase